MISTHLLYMPPEHASCTQGMYAGAEPLYKRSLAIQEAVLGCEHPDVAVTLHSWGVALKSQVKHNDKQTISTAAPVTPEASVCA